MAPSWLYSHSLPNYSTLIVCTLFERHCIYASRLV